MAAREQAPVRTAAEVRGQPGHQRMAEPAGVTQVRDTPEEYEEIHRRGQGCGPFRLGQLLQRGGAWGRYGCRHDLAKHSCDFDPHMITGSVPALVSTGNQPTDPTA
ncbi:hypothetical protein GCM10010121_075370 [Streptomyces brasiliensis]|uniref:Uncharacterized protein n=1 Tax=Streptomyces brasiliensis TaxID=1954 RepID=A0A917L949_9ACTN|nr:hypothetical protein GCM10010121_075370 [Streptomyces brasiliensis]